MAFFMKTMISNQVKNLGFGGAEEKKEEEGTSDPAAAQGMTREEYEEYQKQMIEEKMERDAAFTQRKAERACLRVHLREKYRLPQVLTEETRDRESSAPPAEGHTAGKGRAQGRKVYTILPPNVKGMSDVDESQIQVAGEGVDLPEDLRKMVDGDEEEEEGKDSLLGQLQNLQHMDLDTMKEKAQATFTEMKQTAEQKCAVM